MNDRFKFRVWWEQENRYRIDVKIHPIEKFFRKGFIIEQCTGLKDKNGNLIYEGDIIRYCVNWRAYCLTYIRIVAWDKNTAGFIMVNAKDQVKPLQKWRFPDPDTHIIEIVGNIHIQKEQQ